jgi:hypothetical protein
MSYIYISTNKDWDYEEKYKYGYTPGVKKLESFDELIIPNGSSKFKYKWDDTDGDDIHPNYTWSGHI